MLEKDFLELSEQILISLADYVEGNDKNSVFDAEYADGILNIEVFKTNQTYVINKHSASQKIWYSSPISGAKYFVYNQQKKQWFDNTNKELRQTLLSELRNNFNF
jgi:iron donor protein CyaY